MSFPLARRGFLRKAASVHAEDGVLVVRGETLGLVGESGCGKTTVGRDQPNRLAGGRSGSAGRTSRIRGRKQLRPVRRHIQMVFQDPYASLNPRKRVGTIVGEPLRIHGVGARGEIDARVAELFELVGLARSSHPLSA